jgi:hypothetical protein
MVNELLDDIDSKFKTKKDKVLALKDLAIKLPEVRKILAVNFDHEGEGFKGLPIGVPEDYKPDLNTPVGMSDLILAGVWRKLYIYADVNLNPGRKLQLYLQLIEGLHPQEADIVNMAKDGNLWHKYPWIKDDCYDIIFLGKLPKATKEKTSDVEENDETK